VSLVGRLLGGRYEVGAPLGRGGMAEVHLGRDVRLDRTVAIKVLRSDLARDTHFLARFRREAQAAASLTHPAIVTVFDSGQEDTVGPDGSTQILPYIVMEYVDGLTLRHVLTTEARLTPDEAARVTQGVLEALAYSHRMGIVHRDIKPANVMLSRTGQVKVMDFGIARAIADAESTMTQTQTVMGTAQYLSPEQAQGLAVDSRSDIYSVGCLLFELLTGRPPFVADTPVALAYQHVGQRPQPPSTLVAGIPPAYDALVLHALVKDRAQRYQDAATFRADLAAARSRLPISAAATATAAAFAAHQAAIAAPSARADRHVDGDTSGFPSIDPQTERARRRRRGPAYVALGIAVAAALAVLGYLFAQGVWSDGTVETVSVPYVIGKTEAEAKSLITARGLDPVVQQVPDDEAPKGQVFDQDPKRDTKLPKGATVRLSVSAGPSKVVVPDVVGATTESATQTLALSNLSVSQVLQVDDPSQEKGRVLGTDPAIGQTVDSGSSVVLKVATGKVAVPNLNLQDKAAAAEALAKAGLVLQVVEYVVDGTVAPDLVLSQEPAAGALIEVGSRVKVKVSKPAPSVTTVTVTPPPTTTTTSTTPPP
jgi:serine/threonine-protein kinase